MICVIEYPTLKLYLKFEPNPSNGFKDINPCAINQRIRKKRVQKNMLQTKYFSLLEVVFSNCNDYSYLPYLYWVYKMHKFYSVKFNNGRRTLFHDAVNMLISKVTSTHRIKFSILFSVLEGTI